MISRMSTLPRIVLGWLLLAGPVAAEQGPIRPFKDELFSRQTVIEESDGGAFRRVDYQELRDINRRDRETERRVKDSYVSLAVRRHQVDETLVLSGRRLEVTRVGRDEDAAFTVIFIHGRGGDRRLGANDFSFGGNFNRLKNLAVANGGSYYAPSVTAFDEKGAGDVALLIRHAFEQSAGRPVILACASMGGIICQHIARNREAVRYLKGMALLGAAPDAGLATTPLAKLRLPVYFAHGSADRVYGAEMQEAVYRKLAAAGSPVRFTLFNTGGHGTPIRMVDWRGLLNFLLTAG